MTMIDLVSFPAAVRAAIRRARRALPDAIAFAALYAPALSLTAALGMVGREQAVGGRFGTVVLAFLLAGAVAGPLAWTVAAAVAGQRPATARFAAMLLALALATAATLALVQFAAYQTITFADERHIGAFTLHRLVNISFALISALYVTLSIGLRLILPAGLILLFGGAALFAWRTGPRRG